jgi:hypothetical protein
MHNNGGKGVKQKREEKACVYDHKLILLFSSSFCTLRVHAAVISQLMQTFFEMQILMMFARQFIITNSCVLYDNKQSFFCV